MSSMHSVHGTCKTPPGSHSIALKMWLCGYAQTHGGDLTRKALCIPKRSRNRAEIVGFKCGLRLQGSEGSNSRQCYPGV